AAQGRAVQRRDERDVASRHRLEIGVAVEWKGQPLRAPGLPIFRRPAQIEAGAEIVAVPEDDAALGLFAGPLDGDAQRLHHVWVEAVPLVRPVQPDESDLAFQFIGDDVLFAHARSWFSAAGTRPRCAMTFPV